jgi:hypothetical protein
MSTGKQLERLVVGTCSNEPGKGAKRVRLAAPVADAEKLGQWPSYAELLWQQESI